MPTFLLSALLLTATLATPPASTFPLWPDGKMPGTGAVAPELTTEKQPGDRHITNVSRPDLALYPAPGAGPHPAIVVCPGGAYQVLAYDKEGVDIARWLNSIGVTAAVLKYRVPGNRAGAFEDVQRALRLVRSHAADWNIGQLGIMGFSAGGHLAARASTAFDQAAYPPIDAADPLSCRPDFTVLVYPAYLETHGSLAHEFTLGPQDPPFLLIHAKDDKTFVQGSIVFDAALTAAHLFHQLVLYESGGHGFGLRSHGTAKAWPDACQKWLGEIGVLPATGAK